jgi:hypothetical protein
MITEQQLQNWSKPLSDSENKRCSATVTSISKVLKDKFGSKVDIFLQGSYKNSTNVKQDSDVDIVVCYKEAYFSDLTGLSEQDKSYHASNISSHDYSFKKFKDDVEQALKTEFGTLVERTNKCVRVNKNSYRVNADVISCFVFKRFRSPYHVEAEGIQLFSDKGDIVRSFPKQHYENGIEKNKNTDQFYKSIVRTIKNCRNHLIDNNFIDDKAMPSFFLECLIWNIPHAHFKKSFSYREKVNNVIKKLYADMSVIETAHEYAEVSDLLWLFKGQSERTPEQAKTFLKKVYALIN